MKLSQQTISVLKNFGTINEGIVFKKGKKLKTVSVHKNILAEVDIAEEIPAEFGVHDLNNFLSVISLHKDDVTFEFSDKQAVITGNKGRSKIKYRFCDTSMVVTPPEKELSLGEAAITFTLSSEDFDWILRAASVLSSPNIVVESDGSKVSLMTMDVANDSASTESLEIADGNGDKFRMVFKTENFTKLMQGSYDVSISSKGLSLFKNKNLSLKYWVTTESGSNFTKAG